MCFIFLKNKDVNKSEEKSRHNRLQQKNNRTRSDNMHEEFAGEFVSPIMLEEMEMDRDMINNVDNR
jgi:hypothetical protein